MPYYKVDGEKKDGLQKYNVRVNYTDDNGKAKQLTRVAYGLEAAKDLERKLIDGVKDKTITTASKMTVQQLYDEFIADRKYKVREVTVEKHDINYTLHIKSLLSNICIDKLSVQELQTWKLSMENKGYRIKTKDHVYGTLRAMLNYAVKMEYIAKNPLEKVGNFVDVLDSKPDMVYYTADEFKKFIATAKQVAEERQAKYNDVSEWDFYVFFSIAFYTGLRKGEIHALKWSDIDGVYLSVKRSITQRLKGADRETPPKNKSSMRTLQMPLPLIKVLEEHKIRQEKLSQFTDSFRVCGGVRCLRDTSVQNKNILYAEKSGIKKIRIHDFRHSHVSVLANMGVNIQEIARRLGHARVEMTWNTYSHMYPREEEKAVEILNDIE